MTILLKHTRMIIGRMKKLMHRFKTIYKVPGAYIMVGI